MDKDIKNIFNNNIQLLNIADKIIYYFRTQNYDKALRISKMIISLINTNLELILAHADYFSESNQIKNTETLVNMLRGILQAQEDYDYILLADLYEAQIYPFFLQLQELILGMEELRFKEVSYNEKINLIGVRDPELKKKLSEQPDYKNLNQQGYIAEPASCGLMTLARMENNKKYYFHSNNQITKEAFILAQSWYSGEKELYIVYGLGFGYHIAELAELDSSINIEVYESDINVIQLACVYSDIRNIIKNPKIKIVYDPDYNKLIGRVSNMNEKTAFYLHYPSIRNIRNVTIKEKLEDYFIQFSSINNQLRMLNGNFVENINHYDGLADDLKEKMQSRDLFIVAAGPSLDKNMELLKNINSNGLIIAAGTVLKKLLKAGIIPDFFIVTDANPRVYTQIAELESENIPMLYLSTAYKDFAQNYQGKKYMICQQGYSKAEDYAAKNGAMLFQTGGSVSTAALDIGIQFGCKRIIFLGLDLAYTDNYIHASDTSRRKLTDTTDLRQVEDIHGNMIYTNKSLDIYRQWIENRIKDVKDIEFIDATEGGAKIKGMRIAKLKDVIAK